MDVPGRPGDVKKRPVIILSRNEEIAVHDTVFAVVASHSASYQDPRPDSYIEVPHHPDGLVRTRLKKPTVAICDWITEVDKASVEPSDMAGVVSGKLLLAIVEKVIECHR